MAITRRQLLAAGAGGLAVGALGGVPRAARGSPAPGAILEIFLKGGFDPWRSFFVSGEFAGEGPDPHWARITGAEVPRAARVVGLPNQTLGKPAASLAATALGRAMRVVTLQHDLNAHPAAEPLATTGTRRGMARFGSLAARINASFGDPMRSLILDGGDPETAGYMAEPGAAGAANRPIVLRIDNPSFMGLLDRSASGATRTDDLKRGLSDLYAARLVHPVDGAVRSAGFNAYHTSMTELEAHWSELLGDLGGTTLTTAAIATDPAAPPYSYRDNRTRTAIRAAADLLQRGSFAYVGVVDTGVGANYDTHGNNAYVYDDLDALVEINAATVQAGNMWNLCDELARLSDLGRLDGILVVLNTEFGRRDNDGDRETQGSNHWPWGYVNVLMGGPIAGVKTLGSIGPTTGYAEPHAEGGVRVNDVPYGPTDIRATLAQYAGLDRAEIGELIDPGDLVTAASSSPISDVTDQILGP